MKALIQMLCLIAFLPFLSFGKQKNTGREEGKPSRVVNIVHFIRQMEPRDTAITEAVLYETVHQQIQLLAKYDLPATFLLQYDALINPRYQSLLKDSVTKKSEIGGWWEITQPHVEAAGLVWRGRFPWDWHANVGFATGYTPEERKKLVDTYMAKFKSIFGHYPSTVGCWFIDAYTLGYMYDKYKITASCNMKDQVGTDGYTLWGGYWNNAYYPSRKNAYMPAQHAANQIPIPIFRMLGSDPIYQYDDGMGKAMQHVESLEPVYKGSGANPKWVDYFFHSTFNEPSLNFAYAQAGQENSFTWNLMKDGLLMQIPKLDSFRKAGVIRIETLNETAAWFSKKFPITPPTATSTLNDYRNEGRKTVWFNSRYYRINLLWKDTSFRFRDFHLFDENMEAKFLKEADTSTKSAYYALPVVDGFNWSKPGSLAGLRLVRVQKNGTATEIAFDEHPAVKTISNHVLVVVCKIKNSPYSFEMKFREDRFEIKSFASPASFSWRLELTVSPESVLPFQSISPKQINARFDGFNYTIACSQGKIKSPSSNESFIFAIEPVNNKVEILNNLNH